MASDDSDVITQRPPKATRMTVSSDALHRGQAIHFWLINIGAALLAAAAIAWGAVEGVSSLDITLFITMAFLTTVGIELGFHRGFAHGAYRAGPVMRAILASLGIMAGQGPTAYWIANHRRHHACTDRDGDPHSPIHGFWHAHIEWVLDRETTNTVRFAPDILSDHAVRFVDRLYFLLLFAGIALPAGIGYLVYGTWEATLSGGLWGGGLRMFVVQQLTFSINSICHSRGRRAFRTQDESRNVLLLALPTLGGSLHNNHHAFPKSATLHLLRGDFDPGGKLIELWERMGLVSHVSRPSPDTITKKKISPTAMLARNRKIFQ